MLLCPFEDDQVAHFRPLVDTRPVYGLRVGIHSPLESITARLPHTGLLLHARAYLAAVANEQYGAPVNRFPPGVGVLFVNGRYVPEPGPLLDRLTAIRDGDAGVMLLQGSDVVAAWMPSVPEGFSLPDAVTAEAFQELAVEAVEGATFSCSIPDLVHDVRTSLARDFALRTGGVRQIERTDAMVHPSALVVEPDAIFLAPGAEVRPGAILDASEGPIYLDQRSIVMPAAVLRGPVYVGVGSRINVGANVEGTAIGPGCKVGGEVHTALFHACSNKAHQGFLGHSYVGQWCNFGAGTDASNLRNDYGSIALYDHAAGDFVDTGRQFMGLVFGDHSRCGIDSTFNTGTVVGVGCNLYGPGFHDRFVPAFSWGEPGAYAPYRLDKFLRVADTVMQRRDLRLTDADRAMLTQLHDAAMQGRSTA